MNCKYNAAYDIHRLNAGSREAGGAVDEATDMHKRERFLFVKDSPDLVSYMLALRTGLHMRMVMPAVVPHSAECPFMAMSRFETGMNGNPHQHGFAIGVPAPRFGRVLADVDGNGDVQGELAEDDEAEYENLVLALFDEPGVGD